MLPVFGYARCARRVCLSAFFLLATAPTLIHAQSADTTPVAKGGFLSRMAKKAVAVTDRIPGGGGGYAGLMTFSNQRKAATARLQQHVTPFGGTYRVTVNVTREGATLTDSATVYLRTADRPAVSAGFAAVLRGEAHGFMETGYYISGAVAPTLDSLPALLEDLKTRRDLNGAIGMLYVTRDSADTANTAGVGRWRMAALVNPVVVKGPVWGTTSNAVQQSLDIQARQIKTQAERGAWLDAGGAPVVVGRAGQITPDPIAVSYTYLTDTKHPSRVTVRMDRLSGAKYVMPVLPLPGDAK